MKELQTLKQDLNQYRIVENQFHCLGTKLKRGEILLRIERFAFTSNNVTYGVAGDTIGYWKFFPPHDDDSGKWGCLPVWGFAGVIESTNEEIYIGERVFGYFPPSGYLVLKPVKISLEKFFDGSKHRKDLPLVYNRYIRLSHQQNYDSSIDNFRAILFPLHITSFCLCDYILYENNLESSQIIIISASSKTAIGLAQGLADDAISPKIIGVTSKENSRFVESLGCYDEVITYASLDNVATSIPSVLIDMSGNRAVLGTLHSALGDDMLQCLTVGMTHWNNGTKAEDYLGQMMLRERTDFFFAPSHIEKRISEWGLVGYHEKTDLFMTQRVLQSHEWMKVKEISGLDEFGAIYVDICAGKINPDEGIIVLI